MSECEVIAAPGGNPAPVVALLWALLRQRGLRSRALHVVLYERAEHWFRAELLEGDRPLEQLRAIADDATLGEVHAHVACLADGTPVDDDADIAAALRFVERLWSVILEAQSRGPDPAVVALVGGSRRTLSVDSVVAFQLLARPQDMLVDVRIDPKPARDPRSRFYFPEQHTPAQIRFGDGEVLDADQVRVSIVEVAVPRLRHLLPSQALTSFACALEAGEDALRGGVLPIVGFDISGRVVTLGSAAVKLSYDQAIWFAALAVARRTTPEGWLDVADAEPLEAVFEVCRKRWLLEPGDLSDGWEFIGPLAGLRAVRLGPIRSRLRKALKSALKGHPHRDEVIPEKRKLAGQASERLRCAPSRLHLPPELEQLCK